MVQEVANELQAKLLTESPPYSRMTGGTEYSWCKAVSSGTGSTVLAVLFRSEAANPNLLQAAVDRLQAAHPRLRSRLVWINGRPALSVSPEPVFKLQVLPASEFVELPEELDEENLRIELDDASCDSSWVKLAEREININSEWKEQYHCLDPKPMVALTLYVDIPLSRENGVVQFGSLLAFRLHTAICDRASAVTILSDLVEILVKLNSDNMLVADDSLNENLHLKSEETTTSLVAIEDAIPKGQADKSIWAHGLDILGYSLGSWRHAMLPFENVEESRHSEIIRKKLLVEDTQKLLEECRSQRTSRLGVLMASLLKASAILKELGVQSERHAVVTLLDCRDRLEPTLSKSTIGFYHSAVLNTHLVQGQEVQLWELARQCSEAFNSAVKRRKHFTDMGDVGLLMCQAIQMPQLTPWGSLRTSTLVLFEDSVENDTSSIDVMRSVGILDYIGSSSVHGVGPSVAVFDTLHQGALHFSCVYPSPLHSRSQMNHFLDTMVNILTKMC